MNTEAMFHDGGCTCRFVRYRMATRPLFVHCCRCRWCQRETGASFALNAMVEADRVQMLQGEVDVEVVDTPSNVAEYYKASAVWPPQSLERRAALLAVSRRDARGRT